MENMDKALTVDEMKSLTKLLVRFTGHHTQYDDDKDHLARVIGMVVIETRTEERKEKEATV